MAAERGKQPGRTVELPFEGLERVLQVRRKSPSFRDYMLILDTNVVPPQKLLFQSFDMASVAHEHPLYGYASGWAAVSAALHTGKISIHERMRALKHAQEMWERSKRQFESAGKKATDYRSARLMDLGFRTEEALASLPVMTVAARWSSGTQQTAREIALAQQQTNSGIVKLLGKVYADFGKYEFLDRRIINLQHELLGIGLPNSDPRGRVLVFSSSIQQDHNVDPDLRADLVAVTTDQGHRSGLIQVTRSSKTTTENTDKRMFIRNGLDLSFNGHSTLETVVAFLARENGTLHDVQSKAGLISVSTKLSDRMHTFATRSTTTRSQGSRASSSRR